MTYETGHLGARLIQALLDGRESPATARAARAHALSCAHCQAEIETWQLLYRELSELPRLDPDGSFAERVFSRLSVAAAMNPQDHPAPAHLLDYLDGVVLVPEGSDDIQSHLAACSSCAAEVGEWRALFARLDGLDRLEPTPGFADRVMAGVALPRPAAAPVPLTGRAVRSVRRLLPSGRRAWAALAGVATAPAAVFAAVAWVVLSHPLVSASSVTSFLWWKTSDLLAAGSGLVVSRVIESVTLFRAYAVLEAVVAAPAALFAAMLAGAGLTVAASWVLYRNLVPNRDDESVGHARVNG